MVRGSWHWVCQGIQVFYQIFVTWYLIFVTSYTICLAIRSIWVYDISLSLEWTFIATKTPLFFALISEESGDSAIFCSRCGLRHPAIDAACCASSANRCSHVATGAPSHGEDFFFVHLVKVVPWCPKRFCFGGANMCQTNFCLKWRSPGWCFGWDFWHFPTKIGNKSSSRHWRTPSFFRGVAQPNHQPFSLKELDLFWTRVNPCNMCVT